MKQFFVDSIGRLDLLVWLLVIIFFCSSSLIFQGDLQLSFIGAGGVIIEMMLIGLSIEIIIESLRHVKGIGTLTGFITNGPEALCLIVGLVAGDIIFAASTPLGSNFMNPILLFAAALACKKIEQTFRTKPLFTWTAITLTATMALSFYALEEHHYIYWLGTAITITLVLFFIRPAEDSDEPSDELYHPTARKWLIPAILILLGAGYFLDGVVSFAATQSKAPKGVIGFLVLATLTSWPEFKSCLALLKRGNPLAAILNITISNITNIWLAATGVTVYLLT